MKQLRVGRNPNNDLIISDGSISKYHAVLTELSENVRIIEDLDSTNGTFVNDFRIRRSLVTPQDKVVLGRYLLDLSQIFKKKLQEQQVLGKSDANYTEEFAKLSAVYDQYRAGRLAVRNGSNLKKGVFGAVITVIGNVVFPGFGTIVGSIVRSTYADPEEKLAAISEEFRIAYVCPKCKRFLGDLPYQTLANQRSCVTCKAIWVQ